MSETATLNCEICGKSDWLNVDEYREAKKGMAMCQGCGFLTYPAKILKSEDIKEFYREEYRTAPSVENVFTGQRKLNYHAAVLGPTVFKEWKEKKKDPVVFEVGAAFGMFLNMIRQNFKGAKVNGSELTLTYRRNAWHEYKIELEEEFDESQKYDLIASYKVAEHIPYIGRELTKYHAALKDDGYFYVSVPTWFHEMANFGIDGFTLDYYYHTNHVNVWTRSLFETLLAKHGFEIVQKNTVFYDATYVCKKRAVDAPVPEPKYEEPADILQKLDRIKKASVAFDLGKFEEAIALFPAYPDAHVASYEHRRAEWHQKGFAEIEKSVIERGLTACPESAKVRFMAGDICTRYNEFDKAIGHYKLVLEMRPMDAGAMIGIANIFRALAKSDPKRAAECYQESRDIMRALHKGSFQHVFDTTTQIFHDNAMLPMPSEAL